MLAIIFICGSSLIVKKKLGCCYVHEFYIRRNIAIANKMYIALVLMQSSAPWTDHIYAAIRPATIIGRFLFLPARNQHLYAN